MIGRTSFPLGKISQHILTVILELAYVGKSSLACLSIDSRENTDHMFLPISKSLMFG